VSNGYSQAAVPSIRVPVKTAAGVAFNGLVITATPTTDTAWVAPKGAGRVGFFFNHAAEDSASSTIDIDIEQSPDKGTTFTEMPAGPGVQTGIDLNQITAVGSSFVWVEHCGDGEFTRLRAEVTVGGSTASDTITLGPCYWIFSKVD